MDIYHGLSNELPKRINKFTGAKIVTIHDVIFKSHPDDFPIFDRYTYHKRTQNAVRSADKIVCPSHFTANALNMYYDVHPERIEIIQPSIQDVFHKNAPTKESVLRFTRQRRIEKPYILCVETSAIEKISST